MAKYKLQEMPDVHHDGKRRVYPKMMINRTLGSPDKSGGKFFNSL